MLVLNSGLAYFEFQGGGQAGQMSVQFGDAQVTTSGFTVFRVGMDNPPGQVAVFSGNAHLESAGGNVAADLHGGESIALNGASPANYQLAESIEPDSWDEWNSDRDQALTTEAASQTGATANLGEPQNPAWNDLDANGNWYDVPGQGYVWSPYEAANAAFDPYGYGNWMWTPGYGYLWVSGYPWGYMPFQCGAWNYFDGFGWGWAPGFGGCSPWWGSGFYGGPNFGRVPPGYRPIPRPILPRRPINGRPVPLACRESQSCRWWVSASGAKQKHAGHDRRKYGSAASSDAVAAGRRACAFDGRRTPQRRSRVTSSAAAGQHRGTDNRPGYNFARPEPAANRPQGIPQPASRRVRPSFKASLSRAMIRLRHGPSSSGGESGNHPSGGSSGGGSPRPSGGSPSGGGGGAPHGGGGAPSGGGGVAPTWWRRRWRWRRWWPMAAAVVAAEARP